MVNSGKVGGRAGCGPLVMKRQRRAVGLVTDLPRLTVRRCQRRELIGLPCVRHSNDRCVHIYRSGGGARWRTFRKLKIAGCAAGVCRPSGCTPVKTAQYHSHATFAVQILQTVNSLSGFWQAGVCWEVGQWIGEASQPGRPSAGAGRSAGAQLDFSRRRCFHIRAPSCEEQARRSLPPGLRASEPWSLLGGRVRHACWQRHFIASLLCCVWRGRTAGRHPTAAAQRWDRPISR